MADWIKTQRSIVVGAISIEDIAHRFSTFRWQFCDSDAANQTSNGSFLKCVVRDRFGKTKSIETSANELPVAVADILSAVTVKSIHTQIHVQAMEKELAPKEALWQATADIDVRNEKPAPSSKRFSESGVDSDAVVAAMTAGLRAMAAGNLLSREYRVDNQLFLRDTAKELLNELQHNNNLASDSADTHQQAIVLAALNRVATAAIITATNHPRSESLLQLYDTASWLYDEHGRRRLQNTETKLWLAWFPGFSASNRLVRDVIDSMPSVPDIAIPGIIRLFENPKSRVALPGAMSLHDHDILHVLLGRGLQDQDEAFVLGFAMGSSKKRLFLRRKFFRWIVSRIYPEPYRIGRSLLPAFEQGFQCGRKTGVPDIAKRSLQGFLDMTIDQAREVLKIDPEVIRQAFIAERIAIPLTMASQRLDV